MRNYILELCKLCFELIMKNPYRIIVESFSKVISSPESLAGCLLVSGEAGIPFPRFPAYRLQFTEWHGRSLPMTGISMTGKNCLSGNSVFVMLLLSGIFTCVPGKETLICFENSCVFNFPRLGDFPV